MPTVGFEPTVSAGGRPQTNALDRAATATVNLSSAAHKMHVIISLSVAVERVSLS